MTALKKPGEKIRFYHHG